MRLYLNKKEAELIRVMLASSRTVCTKDKQEILDNVIDRIDLCSKLQGSEDLSKRQDYDPRRMM